MPRQWRLDRLRAEREQALQLIYRQLNFTDKVTGLGIGQEIARLGEEYFVLKAEAYVQDVERAHGGGPVARQLKQAITRWRAIPGEQRQLMEVLQRFLRRTLLILVLAIIGFVFANILYAWVLTRWIVWLLIIVASISLYRHTAAVVREAASSLRTLMTLVLVLALTTPTWAATRCQTYEVKSLGRLQTLCDDGTRAVHTWNRTLGRWESTVTPPPGQTCTGQMNPRTTQVEIQCR